MVSYRPKNQPVRAMCAGVDWAKDDHAVCIVGAEGEALQRFMVTHDRAGLTDMVRRLLRAGVDEVGIERPDGPIVDALLAAGLTVLVIPPGQSRTCAPGTAPPATRTTGSTPTCSPTWSAPIAVGCAL